jgi:RNA polymerase-binding transcription factor
MAGTNRRLALIRDTNGIEETMLSDQEMARLSSELERRRAALVEEIGRKLSASRDKIGSASIDQIIEGGDYASADAMAGLDLAEAQRDVQELREVDAARGRLADGSYGTCVDCGEEIAAARLVAYPTAERCTECQKVYEKRRGLGPGARL